MAQVMPEEIVDHLSSEIRRALEDAVNEAVQHTGFDAYELFQAFRRAVGRKCNTWENVPDSYVDIN